MSAKNIVKGLYVARFIASVAIIGVVVAGAFGFGDVVKLYVAAGGAGVATIASIVKISHLV